MKQYNMVNWDMAMKLKDEDFCKKLNCDLNELE